jgi:hypothetical protein
MKSKKKSKLEKQKFKLPQNHHIPKDDFLRLNAQFYPKKVQDEILFQKRQMYNKGRLNKILQVQMRKNIMQNRSGKGGGNQSRIERKRKYNDAKIAEFFKKYQ